MSMNAYAIGKAQFRLGAEDLKTIRFSPDMRLTETPFVDNAGNTVFLSRAVAWKGKKGAAFENAAPEGVIRGLAKAISISQACKGVEGTSVVGGHRLPNKVICQMNNGTSKKYQKYVS